MMIVSCPCPVLCSALHPASSRLRYMAGAVSTVELLVACGARSPPKFGSFQSSQKLTRGRSFGSFGTDLPSVGS